MSTPLEKNEELFVEQLDLAQLEENGYTANGENHKETAFQAITRHPRTLFWCIYALWVLTLSSYDSQAGGIFLAVPQFRKDFGFAYDGNYVLPAQWQSAYSGGPSASAIMGALGASYLADKIGRKLVYLVAFAFLFTGVTLEIVATTNPVFFAGKFINGFPVGAFGTVTMTYLGEISPQALRGVTTAAAGLSYTLGPFIVSLLLNAYGGLTSRWAYRGIFLSQYGVTVIGVAGWFFMPESPWWLVSRGREKKAACALRGLGTPESDIEPRIAYIKATLEKVRKETEGVTFLECFRNSNLRRTIIAIAPLSIQALIGILFVITYMTYYIQLAGYTASISFKISIGATVLSMAGNITSWFLVDRVGRRHLSLYGLSICTAIMLIVGGLGTQTINLSCIKAVIAMLLLFNYVYNVTIGATAYNLLAETATPRLRAKTASIGLALQNALYTMFSFVYPYLFNPNEANLGAKVTFIFGGFGVLAVIYMWFYQPETSGRSYEELDEMFVKRIPARKFKSYLTEVEQRGQ